MSVIKVERFKASDIIVDLHTAFDSFTDAQTGSSKENKRYLRTPNNERRQGGLMDDRLEKERCSS
ncbi:hypothetical protein BDR04DRAFT_1162788 [Suillus decipiens]|nr:hypothetical protein BDR04DRAFT_1162782 [Suillus decipiens]KAG2064241.1 hypothetical protein BDR04DRAFT_1162788 [Suillus decipiens]